MSGFSSIFLRMIARRGGTPFGAIPRLFVEEGRPERKIASILNDEGRLTDLGRPWTRGTVHQVLTNEKYIGNNVYNRVSFKLKNKRVVNPPDMWIRADGAFAAIVDSSVF